MANTAKNKLGKQLARNVARFRRDSDLSKKAFADAIGLSPDTIRRIENAHINRVEYNPMLKTVLKLAKVADVSVDDFIDSKLSFQ